MRDASRRATKAFYRALSVCDLIFSGSSSATESGDGSPEGMRLLAHELVHVMQWGGRPIPADLPIGPTDGLAERQAEAADARGGYCGTASMQRAVRVCDEYQAEDTGSGAPAPGITVDVSRSGKSANVNALMQVFGPEADAAKAATIRNTIDANWNASFPDGYRITTNVAVGYRPPGQSEDSTAAQIRVVRAGAGYTTGTWMVGSRQVTLNLDYAPNELQWGVAHEFGHLLGLGERYSESFCSKLSSFFGGRRFESPEPGYENNIMGADEGRLESKNVQDLIALYTDYHCTRWRIESPL